MEDIEHDLCKTAHDLKTQEKNRRHQNVNECPSKWPTLTFFTDAVLTSPMSNHRMKLKDNCEWVRICKDVYSHDRYCYYICVHLEVVKETNETPTSNTSLER